MNTPHGQSGALVAPGASGWPGAPDHLPGLGWTAGPDGTVRAVAGRWLDWTGMEPGRAAGDGWLDALHPGDAGRVREQWRSSVASGSTFAARFRVGPGRDGAIRWLVARAEPSLDPGGRAVGWSGLAVAEPDRDVRDVVGDGDGDDGPSPRVSAVGEDFAIFWIASKRDYRLTSVSPSCERLLGRPVAELAGGSRSWADLAHPDDRPRVLDAYARRESGEEAAVEFRLMRPDGSEARVRDRVLPGMTGSMGDPARVFGVLEDVGGTEAADASPAGAGAEGGAEARLAELVEGLGDLFLVVDGAWRCTAANAQALGMCDPGGVGVIGRPLWEVVPELVGSEGQERLRSALAGHRAVEFEQFLGRPGLWFEFRGYPVADGLALIGRDVTEAKANRLALLEVEERYRLAAEAVVGLIYDWRVDSGLVHRSPGLLAILGIPVEEAEPTNTWWRDRIHPDDLPRLDEELARMMADPLRAHYSFEYRVRHRDGRYVDVWDKGFCLRDGRGKVVRVVGNSIDISERRHAEEALREADRMKDEFLGMLAHELRNPLSPILSAAQALRAGADDPGGELRAIIERQARHMARLVDDLLDVSRISHGKILVEPVPLDAVELVRQTLGNFGDLLRDSGLNLRAELPEGPVAVLADPTRLAQCVGNLLHNAAKFTEPGGTVSVSVSPGAEEREARITVRDTGIGIAPEVLPTLFRAYSQADRSHSRNRGGLGLGLALVKNLVEMQGGRVEVLSEGEGRGSTFTLRLPLRVDLAGRLDSLASGEHAILDHAPASRALRLLVVDDRPDMAHILSRMLRSEGHQVAVAGDAEEALEQARRLRPEVVISDIGLPGAVDGYGLAEALRADPETASALLIAVTGYARADDRAKAFRCGYDEHLTKPLDFAALCDRLAQVSPRPSPPGRRG
ncbi:PAS domain-containing protein [Tautonia plasticadhaerens]|uniref:histidine kinase n=1 Tax=Tautonia plasticadhaerens TaxID=2527974 RepID=A0A518HDR4_9BACT|nr:PAS domain-containing protein [Tautonia plasticadhaerens]QDV38997.1 Alkaline phosphatase synthesis sensor protein PhoR [Tautonia plasticadhaerens]